MRIIITLILLASFSLHAGVMVPFEEVGYTDREGRIIDAIEKKKIDATRSIINDKKRTYVPNFERKKNYNENLEVLRDDKRIITIPMNVDDVVKTQICFNSPLRITIGPTIGERISEAYVDDRVFSEPAISKDEKSVYVVLKEPIKGADESWRTGIRLVRKSDSRAYFFSVEAIACPEGDITLPREIFIIAKNNLNNPSEKVMVPEDLITELSYALPRQNNENVLDVYDGVPTTNSDWIVLGVSLKIVNPNRKKVAADFVFLDSLQVRELESQTSFLTASSQKITNDTGVSTLRFNIKLKVNKRYIMERNYVYLMMIDHEGKYYQYAKIPLRDLYKKKSFEGYELNL